MANPADVLYQLQIKLDVNDVLKNIEINKEEIEEDIGQGNYSFGFGNSLVNSLSNDGADIDDVENLDTPYITHMQISNIQPDKPKDSKDDIEVEGIREQDEEETEDNSIDKLPTTPKESETEIPSTPEPDMNINDVTGENPGDLGMGTEPESQKATDLGRIYELKKIYSRLTTIESYLSDSSDPELLRIRLLVSKSIELFEVLSSNIPSFKPPLAPKERIDEIIVMYYKFIKQIYESVAKHHKNNKDDD